MAKSNEERIAALELMLAHLQEQVSNLQDQIWEMKSSSSSTTPAAPQTPEGVDAEVARLVRAGEKISAIKRIREMTGMGLAEAKREAERLEVELARSR